VYSEIGSEFWIEQNPKRLLTERDGAYVLSGRTAIDLILQDIMAKREAKSVYIPAWCCDSMLAPFRSRGVKVDLYDVSYDGKLHYYIDESKTPDIFYVNNYFGYENTISHAIIESFKQKGSMILYDKTHSLLVDGDDLDANYSFASIRKWMGVASGAVVEGIEPKLLNPYPYTDLKEVAMKHKYRFLQGDKGILKDDFLNAFCEFGHRLEEDYRDYEMDALSYTIFKQTDIEAMKHQRRSNAKVLHKGLNLNFLGELTPNVTPLFVPVFFDSKEERDEVRKRLIDNQIYCPVHWPKNNMVSSEMRINRIFDTELSIICDQRYGQDEMKKIIQYINK
jgi:hypothetical protein